MTAYFDSSALAKRYLTEPDSPVATSILDAEPIRVTSMITSIEVRRALAQIVSAVEHAMAREQLIIDLTAFQVAHVDVRVCERAASIAEATRVRTLDSLHLATAVLLGCTRFVTFDRRQAGVAEELGMTVIGG